MKSVETTKLTASTSDRVRRGERCDQAAGDAGPPICATETVSCSFELPSIS